MDQQHLNMSQVMLNVWLIYVGRNRDESGYESREKVDDYRLKSPDEHPFEIRYSN